MTVECQSLELVILLRCDTQVFVVSPDAREECRSEHHGRAKADTGANGAVLEDGSVQFSEVSYADR